MTDPNRSENSASDELTLDELNSVVGGTEKTKPKDPPPAKPQGKGIFEIEDYSFS
jgi:hypothetical protein